MPVTIRHRRLLVEGLLVGIAYLYIEQHLPRLQFPLCGPPVDQRQDIQCDLSAIAQSPYLLSSVFVQSHKEMQIRKEAARVFYLA